MNQPVTNVPDSTWPAAPENFVVESGAAHVWCAKLHPAPMRVAGHEGILSPDEKERAGRFRLAEDRGRYILGRAILRRILGGYLGEEASRIRFDYGAHGKPALPDAGDSLHFNLAHSRNLALIAITGGGEIGVDLEYGERAVDIDGIASRFFAQSEYAAIAELDGDPKRAAFFTCWTRKEAYVKARGAGLTVRLNTFEVSVRADAPARLVHIDDDPEAAARWSLSSLSPAPGYLGAVAVNHPDCEIECWAWKDAAI